jgi:hypothetical protein
MNDTNFGNPMKFEKKRRGRWTERRGRWIVCTN